MTTFKTDTGGANGLFFDKSGNLLACQGANKRLVSIDMQGNVTVLADKYSDKTFNEPNDLWIDSKGGVYFSDPLYFGTSLVQDGEHVYYLTPKRDNVVRVVADMTRPNGIIGTADGKTLYVADHGAGKIYKYTIAENGSLTDKTLFVSVGSDGMTIDSEGNIYLTNENGVQVYTSSGSLIETIDVPLDPTNVCFGGKDGKTLFITAKTAVYSLAMNVKGLSYSESVSYGLSDTISVLQILSGMEPAITISKEADINGDGKIGLPEAFYFLKKLAGDYSDTTSSFTLTSDAGIEGGTLPLEYTCDGAGSAIALSWSGVSEGTEEFALMMTTLPGDGTTKWNWVLYGIPGTATGLAKNSTGVGTLGACEEGSPM